MKFIARTVEEFVSHLGKIIEFLNVNGRGNAKVV